VRHARRILGVLFLVIGLPGLVSDVLWWCAALPAPVLFVAAGLVLTTVDLWWPTVRPGRNRPSVKFDVPRVVEHGVRSPDGSWVGMAHFVVLAVANHPPPRTPATDFHARLRVETAAGTPLLPEMPARYADKVPADDVLPPNGQPFDLDTVVHFPGEGECWVWNDHSKDTVGLFGTKKLETHAVKLHLEGPAIAGGHGPVTRQHGGHESGKVLSRGHSARVSEPRGRRGGLPLRVPSRPGSFRWRRSGRPLNEAARGEKAQFRWGRAVCPAGRRPARGGRRERERLGRSPQRVRLPGRNAS
jgi:hypothetical protein